MKKSRKMGKMTGVLLASAALVLAVTGCGEKAEEEIVIEQLAEPENVNGPMGEQYIGKVSALTDDTVVVTLAEMPELEGAGFEMPEGELPEGGKPEGELPEGEQPEGMPEGEFAKGEKQEGEFAKGEKPESEKPEGGSDGELLEGMPQGQFPGGMNFSEEELTWTDETKTFEIGQSTVISVNGEESVLSDLAVGDIVTVFMDGDSVQSVMASK